MDWDISGLDELVQRLAAAVDPERIVLFGSRARGDHGGESDFDILIVADSALPKGQRLKSAYPALRGFEAPVDLL